MLTYEGILRQLKKIPGWSATNEHVEFLREVLATRDQELESIRSECDQLRDANEELKETISKLSTPTGFKEYRGVLWRNIDGDNVEPSPYCKTCKNVMVSFANQMWVCGSCKTEVPLVKHPHALKE